MWIQTPYLRGAVPMVVIAAVDTPAKMKRHADYLCDGTDDHIQVQAAITAATAAGLTAPTPSTTSTYGGCTIYLLPGNFHFGGSVWIRGGLGIEGAGQRATVINMQANAPCPALFFEDKRGSTLCENWAAIKNLGLYGNLGNVPNRNILTAYCDSTKMTGGAGTCTVAVTLRYVRFTVAGCDQAGTYDFDIQSYATTGALRDAINATAPAGLFVAALGANCATQTTPWAIEDLTAANCLNVGNIKTLTGRVDGICTKRLTGTGFPTSGGLWDTVCRDLNIMYFRQDGLHWEQTWGCVFDSIVSEFNAGYGMYIRSGPAKVLNLKAITNTLCGLYVSAANGTFITGCELDSPVNAGDATLAGCLTLDNCTGVTANNLRLTGQASGTCAPAILLKSSLAGTYCRQNTISNVTCPTAVVPCPSVICIRDNSYDNLVIGNMFSNIAFGVPSALTVTAPFNIATGPTGNRFENLSGFVQRTNQLITVDVTTGTPSYAVAHGLTSPLPNTDWKRRFVLTPANNHALALMPGGWSIADTSEGGATGTTVTITFGTDPTTGNDPQFYLTAIAEAP